MLDKDRRASLVSSCSKTITKYKFDLMTFNLNILENIQRGHRQLLMTLKDKFVQSSCPQALKQAIEDRQTAMKKRHEVYLKYKLQ